MPWKSTAINVGASVLGGALGGSGSKSAERAARDAAALAQFTQEQAQRQTQSTLQPYQELGTGAANTLAQLLGVADPVGYAKRPTLQQFEEQLRADHFKIFGKDYGRNSDVAGQTQRARSMYDQAMQEWEAGKNEYIKSNPNSTGSGDLLKNFTLNDFVKDPGYEFRLAEGEKALNRQAAGAGSMFSGATLKALNRYNQDYATNEFTNAYNRDSANKSRTYGFLTGASGQGLQGAGMGVSANTNAANVNSQVQSNLGNSLASLYQVNADNRFNQIQNGLGNALYAFNRSNIFTNDQNPTMTGGSSRDPNSYTYTRR